MMVDLHLRPSVCELCRTGKPALIRRERDGKETWLCWECVRSLYREEDDDAPRDDSR